ncbi:MAG: cell envelope integrity protein CreD [Pseudomonadota bacterium]
MTTASDDQSTATQPANAALRLFGLGFLLLLLAIPLGMIEQIVAERVWYRADAERSIGASWGQAQAIAGPVLVVPVIRRVASSSTAASGLVVTEEETVQAPPLILLPDRLDIDARVETEMRKRGIFEMPVYRAELDHRVGFQIPDTAHLLGPREEVAWDDARLMILMSSTRAIRAPLSLRSAGSEIAFEPGSGLGDFQGIQARVGDPREGVPDLAFTLSLNGSQSLAFAPAGRETRVDLDAAWPHPSFTGSFLPESREMTAETTQATWRIPHLARPVAQAFRGMEGMQTLWSTTFGFSLFQPVDLYHKAERAAKYGVLFIALTFCVIFLLERTSPRPARAAQYLLVSAAQCVFFLLLLSLAEQIGFLSAYLIAAVATVALLLYYGWQALQLGRRLGHLAAGLGVVYGAMFVVLQSEDQALLIGSILAFLAVAATMVATRHEDWGGFTLPKLRRRKQAA